MNEPLVLLSAGPFSVTVYSLCVSAAFLLSALLLRLLLPKGDPLGLAVITGLGALIGARLVFCLACLPMVMADLGGLAFFPRVWQGGFSGVGAFGGGALAAFLYEKAHHRRFSDAAVSLMASAFLALMIARIAEIATLQGVGDETDSLTFFPFAVWSEYQYSWRIPVFFWEALASLAGLVFCVARRNQPRTAVNAFGWLCVSQIFLESLREDDCIRFGFTRFGQLACTIALLGILIAHLIRKKSSPSAAFARVGLFLLCAAGLVGIEFALDRTSLSHVLLYCVMAGILAGIYAVTLSGWDQTKQ